MSRFATVAVLLAAATLGGCGELGTLAQPAPLFGAQAKADYAAKQKQAKIARARAKADRDQSSSPDDPNVQPLNQAPYSNPIPGGPGGGDTPPEGALPNPGVTPSQ